MSALSMTTADLQAWRRLVKQARIMGATPTMPTGDLRAAAAKAHRAVAPTHEALKAICSPLIRLASAWPGMDDGTRRANAERLLWLAEALAPLVGAPEPREGRRPVEDPAPAREPRRDIWG